MKNLRDQIKEILNIIWQTKDLQAGQASEYLYELSAMLGNVGEKIVEYEKLFISKKVEIMNQNPKMSLNRIELLAKDTAEWGQLREVFELRIAMVEVIRSLKYRIRHLEDEREASDNL